jgi:hypothetical protein
MTLQVARSDQQQRVKHKKAAATAIEQKAHVASASMLSNICCALKPAARGIPAEG